ncbi:MAG: hypothetical protein ABI779_08600 [Acidobacteriota bacterium]
MSSSFHYKSLVSLAVVVSAIFGGVFAFRRAYVASASHLVDVRVTRRGDGIRIDGFIFDSGMRVSRSTQQRVGSSILVRIYIAPILDSDEVNVRRGDFHPLIVIPEAVTSVAIGESPRFVTLGHILGVPIRVPRPFREAASMTIWSLPSEVSSGL